MASSWSDSWGTAWGDSWGAVASTTAVPARRFHYVPEEIEEEAEQPLRKKKKLKIKPSLKKAGSVEVEKKRDLVLEKITAIGQKLSLQKLTTGDRVRHRLEQRKLKLEQQARDYQEALEYFFEMELQRKIREKDIIYVAMIMMSEL